MSFRSEIRSLGPVAAGLIATAFAGILAVLAGYLVILGGVFYCLFTRGYENWKPFLDRLALFVALPVAVLVFIWLWKRSYRWCQSGPPGAGLPKD